MRTPGMPIEKIDNLFEKMVDKYRFDKNHKFEFQAKGSDKIESIALQKAPHLTTEKKSMLLDAAAGKVKLAPLQPLVQSI